MWFRSYDLHHCNQGRGLISFVLRHGMLGILIVEQRYRAGGLRHLDHHRCYKICGRCHFLSRCCCRLSRLLIFLFQAPSECHWRLLRGLSRGRSGDRYRAVCLRGYDVCGHRRIGLQNRRHHRHRRMRRQRPGRRCLMHRGSRRHHRIRRHHRRHFQRLRVRNDRRQRACPRR